MAETVLEKARAKPAGARGKLISCEEAFTIPEIVAELTRLAGGVPSMSSGPIAGPFMPLLLDIGEARLRTMDADGIDIQVLAVSSPGVQLFDPATALTLARLANDRLAEAVKAHPDRFAGLATVPPQAPAEAARELERAVRQLGLKGAMINSHTKGEYLDDRKFWPILEAAAALDVPIYLHPREPSSSLAGAFIPGFTVGWGFAVETGTHLLRIIASGAFDAFPKLKIVVGHMGETIPFLLARIDNRHQWEARAMKLAPLKRLPGDYFRENIYVTTSGMNYSAPLLATIATLGADRILFAADYPMENQAEVVGDFEAITLSDADARKIREDNARKVFKL